MLRKEVDGRARIRMLAMHHLQLGKSLQAVAEIVQVHWKTVQSWLRHFRTSDISCLYDAPRSGAPKKIIDDAERWLYERVKTNSEDRTGGCITGKGLQQQLLDLYGVQCSLKTVYNKLHELSFSWMTSRSVHPQANTEAQEDYKKTFTDF
jgi:transposase